MVFVESSMVEWRTFCCCCIKDLFISTGFLTSLLGLKDLKCISKDNEN